MKYKHLNALVVDDDETVRFLAKIILDYMSIKNVCVSNGAEAIQKLPTQKFDFILMDIHMPGEDGLDAVRWIRELNEHQYKDIPIFALTSFSTEDHKREALNAGFNEHITKPLLEENLVPLLDKYFWKLS